MRHTVFFIRTDPFWLSLGVKMLSKMEFLIENFEIFESKLSIRAWLKSNVCPPLNDGSKIKQFMVFRLRQAYCGFTKMRFYQFRNNL